MGFIGGNHAGRWVGLWLLAAAGTACTSTPPLPDERCTCSFNSDCGNGSVCVTHCCRAACHADVNCTGGGHCQVTGDGGLGACLLAGM